MIDIWKAPIVILNEKDGGPKTTSLAELYPSEANPPFTFIPEAEVSINGKLIGKAIATSLIPEGLGESMGYREVKTPQTPGAWGNSSSILVCTKFGDWQWLTR